VQLTLFPVPDVVMAELAAVVDVVICVEVPVAFVKRPTAPLSVFAMVVVVVTPLVVVVDVVLPNMVWVPPPFADGRLPVASEIA
jgi:hypothetical protein